MRNTKFLVAILCVVIALAMISCAPGPNTFAHTTNVGGHIAGFWLGLWHGIISPFTFIGSLFTSSVNFYEVHNNGGWYNFGFLLGIGTLGGSSGRVSK